MTLISLPPGLISPIAHWPEVLEELKALGQQGQQHKKGIYLIKTLNDHLFTGFKCWSMCMDCNTHFSLPA